MESISPFYVMSFVNLIMGVGLMSDAMTASTAVRDLRIFKYAVHNTIESSTLTCANGQVPILKQNSNIPSFINLAQTSDVLNIPDIPNFPNIPDIPLDTLPDSPGYIYEWFAIHLRWICSVLSYFVAIYSLINKILYDILIETKGQDIANVFNNSQGCIKWIEFIITCLSFIVYICDKVYELYIQYFLSTPRGLTTNKLWPVFIFEVVIILIVGILSMIYIIIQYLNSVNDNNNNNNNNNDNNNNDNLIIRNMSLI